MSDRATAGDGETAEPRPSDEWAVLSVRLDCLTRTAECRFFEEAESGRSGWHRKEARYHVYKAHDQLSVASYHARQGGEEAGRLLKANLADCLNHLLMAMATVEVDLGECQPVTSIEDLQTSEGSR